MMQNSKKNTPNRQRDSASLSPWQETAGYDAAKGDNSSENSNKVYDCLIIGAGITGITTALLLQRSGLNCLVAEAGQAGFGTTGGTTAHLNTFFDATYPDVENDFGLEAAQLLARGGNESLDQISSFVAELNIDCDLEFKQAWLYAENEKESRHLAQILDASERAGLSVTPADQNGVPVPFDSAVKFERQGQFHPLKYTLGLLTEYLRLGGELAEYTRIRQSSFADGIYTAKSDECSIRAKRLVYATHIPPGVNLMSFRNAPYRSYVLALKLQDSDYPEGLSYDMQEPYHYFRSHRIKGQKYLIVGGEDHKTGHGDSRQAFANLKAYASRYYNVAEVDYQWSAQYYVPVDGLPYIGQMPAAGEGTYVATGFNGNGMIFGTLSARIISDLILGKKNQYAALFSPSRMKPVAGFTEFVKENADVAWHFIADRFSSEELQAVADLKPSEGKLVEFQGTRLAVYKDDSGKVTALNPTCTHAGCIVQFNAFEQSWDCPCHGGRFDVSGKVLTGPPTMDLERVLISETLEPGKG